MNVELSNGEDVMSHLEIYEPLLGQEVILHINSLKDTAFENGEYDLLQATGLPIGRIVAKGEAGRNL